MKKLNKKVEKLLKKKIKVLTLGDHPLMPSGVGTQSKYVFEALLNTGGFEIITLGGAVGHDSYEPIRTEKYKDDWIIYPVDNYGTPDIIRSIIRTHKPDILWFMTDPRFYSWLWQMEDEIRVHMPMIYYHVWDNKPIPVYNRCWYDSTDTIVSISKVTHEIVEAVASPEVGKIYLPHAVNQDIFKIHEKNSVLNFHKDNFGSLFEEKFLFFWNNRNARRKMSGSLLFWFKDFLEQKNRYDDAALIMHTDPSDQHGQDIIKFLGLQKNVAISRNKYSPEILSYIYNSVDCTLNISDAEGFGLSTLESLACGTPIIVSMTGGLQEQVTNGTDWFGIGIEPSSKAVIGSQDIPWIYEDRISSVDFIEALEKMVSMAPEERKELSMLGTKHISENYNFANFENQWIDIMTDLHKKHGSWPNKLYKRYDIQEIL
jgi:glycosyltransferase involved in cell wall biosynthesis